MALAGFPVSARQIFLAKFGALVLLFAAFVIALTGPLAGVFGVVIRGRWQENPSGVVLAAATFAALAAAGAFVFFALLALQGVLLNLVPGRWFLRASLFVQATLFIATVGALPLYGRQPLSAAWWPPVWFLRLWWYLPSALRWAARIRARCGLRVLMNWLPSQSKARLIACRSLIPKKLKTSSWAAPCPRLSRG
jgi:hypothetical protein